jgi:AcrR family transcriptional regulator
MTSAPEVDVVNLVSRVDAVNQPAHEKAMAESRRESLISAAAQLLDQGGPAAVTLREVGRVAGVSHNAPYKHFADKEDLLAAIAGRELNRQGRLADDPAPGARAMMLGYVRWALRYPERFKLTFGRWARGNAELADAAQTSRARLVEAVRADQAACVLPAGDPERLTALLLALAHGAADLALGGHLARDGKGRADPDDLIEDLFAYLRAAARAD